MVEAFAEARGQTPLYFDRPEAMAPRQLEQKVDFGACSCAIEARRRSFWSSGEQVLDDKALPTGADHGMSCQCIIAFDAEEGMNEAAVADVHLRRLDQALACVGVERPQSAHK